MGTNNTEQSLNSQEDQEKLFRDISRAMREQDSEKLDALMEAPLEVEEPIAVNDTTSEVAVANTTPTEEKKEDTPPEEAEVEDTSKSEDEKQKDKPQDAASLPADELARLKEENHRLKSQAGRVPSLQRKQQELEKKLTQILKNGALPSSQPKLSSKVTDKLKALEADDPALAQTLHELLADQSEEIHKSVTAGTKEAFEVISEREALDVTQRELGKLMDMYPNAVEVFQNAHWQQWVRDLPESWQQLSSSMYADDVALLFERYKRDLSEQYPDMGKKDVTPVTDTAAEPPAKAAKVQEERERKLHAPVVKSVKTSPKQELTDDPTALFKQAYEKIVKDNHLVRPR